jgi:two-component system response regulator QseB
LLLVVEDDPLLGPAIVEGLSGHFHADLVTTLEDARLSLETGSYDLVLLDLVLPDGSGLDLLSEIRRRELPVAVIVLTALDAPRDRVAGLQQGADDYVGKPFDLGELIARCETAVRHARGQPAPVLTIGPLRYDKAGRTVTLAGEPVTLSATELRVLDALVARKGRIISKDEIEERLYRWSGEVESNTVEVYVSRLRRKIGKELIRTVRGVGYMIAG